MQIKTENVDYTYMIGTPFEKKALTNLNFSIPSHSYTAIIGHTGSGKSTFVQLINGLLKPSKGSISIGDYTVTKETKQKHLYPLRKIAGMVFQYPEHQLFDETVLSDVMYGPKNFNHPLKEAEKKAKEMLSIVGIQEKMYGRSPFELSGGQMRRVAIAGVLASEPAILILDEPTAGLDPQGQEEIMEMIHQWYEADVSRSVILVTHSMEDAAKYAQQVLVMSQGELSFSGTPDEVYVQEERLNRLGLSPPQSLQLLSSLKKESGEEINIARFNNDDTVSEIMSFLNVIKKVGEK